MLLQRNLPLEFKECGTLLGRFWKESLKLGGLFFWEDWRNKEKKWGISHSHIRSKLPS